MDFDGSDSKPPSNSKLLYQQVEEQSDICDVTIQVGQWKKKFHWCVLVMSPFFECIWRSDYIEKRMGLVKLDFAAPVAAESAIMFLYGKEPELTMDSVAEILELAEFLLIPSLKSKCVNFIKDVRIKRENCIKMLNTSSLYGFEFDQCRDYIRAHLQEILRKDEAVCLTKESVLNLLTDPMLSYVSAEEKFEFAIRWAKTSKRHMDAFEDVFKTIDVESMDGEFLKTVVLQDPLVTEMRIDISDLHVRTRPEDHSVLVFPKLLHNDKIVCFDIEINRWCQIEAGLPEGSSSDFEFKNAPVVGTRRPRDVYRVTKKDSSWKIYLQDLHSKKNAIKTISGNTQQEFYSYDISRNTFVAVSYDRTRREVAAILYCGQLQGKDIIIDPIFSIPKTPVISVCINEHNVVALFSITFSQFYIYDITSCQLDNIALEDQPGFVRNMYYIGLRVKAKENGFVLYNEFTVLDISRLNGPALTDRYAVHSTKLEFVRHWDFDNYIFSNNIWFHIWRKRYRGEVEVSCVKHDELMTSSPESVTWNQLPSAPEDIELSNTTDAFIVELPKSLLRCHYDCPHCLRQKMQKYSRSGWKDFMDTGGYIFSSDDDDVQSEEADGSDTDYLSDSDDSDESVIDY